jgi:F-box and WD-40 domain protein 1/11
MNRRAFPVSEWAPAQESHSSNESFAPSLILEEPENTNPVLKPRQRLMSLPFSDLTSQLEDLDIAEESSKHRSGLRGLFRRASVSLRAKKPRRHSHAMEERPNTASSTWKMLRQAASFNKHPRHHPMDGEEPADSCELAGPVPGFGTAPPVIPQGNGGAAARATAAAQNEYLGRFRQFFPTEDLQTDCESGIGIALTLPEPAVLPEDDPIRKVDFIGKLPVELSIQVLAHLDHFSLVNTAKVSKAWAKVTASQHVWREAFLRDKAKTYAMSTPAKPGTGLGIPQLNPRVDWKELHVVRQQLESNWKKGKAQSIYLNGHLDSIYCVQFDEYVCIFFCLN